MTFPLLFFDDYSNHRAFAANKSSYFFNNEYVQTFLGITVLVDFDNLEGGILEVRL